MKNNRAPRRDDVIDTVRTIYWFQYLAKCIGSSRPRDIQRAVLPMPATDALGGIIKNNRFLAYSRGSHVPNVGLVQRAEDLYPRSAQILNHVLWDVLRANEISTAQAQQWIRQLDLDIQRAFVRQNNGIGAGGRTYDMLVRRFGLDSLTALTILFRLSVQDSRSDEESYARESNQAWLYACGIFRVLMMTAPQFLTADLKKSIFQLFVQRVFNLVTSFWGAKFDLSNYDYPEMASSLKTKAAELQIDLQPPISADALGSMTEIIEIPMVSAETV